MVPTLEPSGQRQGAFEFLAELNLTHNKVLSDQGRAGGTWAHWQVAIASSYRSSPNYKQNL